MGTIAAIVGGIGGLCAVLGILIGFDVAAELDINDLGYMLFEMGNLDEAEAILNRAIDLAPSDYVLPRNNMEEVKRKRSEVNATKQR